MQLSACVCVCVCMERVSGGEPRKENRSSVVMSDRKEEELVGGEAGPPYNAPP